MNKVIIYQSKFLSNKKRVDFEKKELYFTEKFALLNLLTALGKLNAPNTNPSEPQVRPQEAPQTPPPPPYEAQNNMFARVLERHEAISNRVRNKK